MKIYYNENDPYPAQWLRNLMDGDHISKGVVDERDIREIQGTDLNEYDRAHFFAGIGGWEYALNLAGWPIDQEVWTGSPPCQPFSKAGKRSGFEDERDLFPVWLKLIEKCRPPVIFGEQVSEKDGLAWLGRLHTETEKIDYSVAAACLPAGSIGAPHIRERIWWVANANSYSLRFKGVRSRERWSWPVEQFKGLLQDTLQSSVPSGKHRALVDGVQQRTPKLRAYGNAIVPQVAAEFIGAFMDTINQEIGETL